MKRIVFPGNVYGRWTVLEVSGRKAKCRCACGTERLAWSCHLPPGTSTSCGCHSQEQTRKHGEATSNKHLSNRGYTPEYMTWMGMRARCGNPSCSAWARYGGRGVKVCERWDDFNLFLADMGRRPSGKHSIDRIDNDGPYSPENCRWATAREQAENMSTTKRYSHAGFTGTLRAWSERTGISVGNLRNRIGECGWDFARAVTTPVKHV